MILAAVFEKDDSGGVTSSNEASYAANDPDDTNVMDRSAQHSVVVLSRDGVRARLKDPDSAEFRNVGYYSGGPGMAVCGEVNAKNSFGGYSGFERFVALGEDTAFLESDTSASEFQDAWNQLCIKSPADEVQLP